MILVHAGWLAGLWVLGYNRTVIPVYLAAFLVQQIGRYWVLATFGRRWTTQRAAGRDRLMRHPNMPSWLASPRSSRWRSICPFIRWYFSPSMQQPHICAYRSTIRP
jgi:hypothetical protein